MMVLVTNLLVCVTTLKIKDEAINKVIATVGKMHPTIRPDLLATNVVQFTKEQLRLWKPFPEQPVVSY